MKDATEMPSLPNQTTQTSGYSPRQLGGDPPAPLRPEPRSILRAWLPAIIWLGLIALESTDTFSSEHTSRVLFPIFHFFTGVDPGRFASWHFYIRKGGHFVGYSSLSFLLFRALRTTLPRPDISRWASRWSMSWATLAFLLTTLVASLDEWHQSYIPSRTGTYKDVVLDSSAALFAQAVILVISLLLRSPS
jgi:VanZ family protein